MTTEIDPVAIVSLTLGLVSLAGVVYQLGYRNAGTDKTIKDLLQIMDKYPLAEINKQVTTMWEVYVMDALHARTDLATHKSPLQITDKGEAMIPQDVKDILISHVPDKTPMEKAATWIVVSCLGTIRIADIVRQMNLSTSVTLSLLSVFYRKYHPETELDSPVCDASQVAAS